MATSTATTTETAVPNLEHPRVTTNDVPNDARIEQLDGHAYLFGKKIDASLSPPFHAAIFEKFGMNWEQVRLD